MRLPFWLLLGGIAAPALHAQQALPAIGIAVSDTARDWCAAFSTTLAFPALSVGARVTLVFADSGMPASMPARIRARRTRQCPAAFPQPRWHDYIAYDLEPIDETDAGMVVPPVALVVAGDAPWTRGTDGRARADLDADGHPEALRRCFAHEGEHLTLWSARPAGDHVRRWHEYYDWGAEVDPTCGPGESGGS